MSDLLEFRFIGSHAESLDGGRMIEPGGFTGPIDVSDESPHNQQLLEQGLLVEVPDGTHAEYEPEEDSDPELSNEAQLTPPDDEPDEDIRITSPPVTRTSVDIEGGDGE